MKHDCDPICQAWYMRDNHTFVKLPSDVEEAMKILREEICVKRYSHGMLCSTLRDPRPDPIHAHGWERYAEFERNARAWFVDFNRAAAMSYSENHDYAQQRIDADDAKRFRWWFGPFDAYGKSKFVLPYIEGCTKGWTIDQWRAAIDAVIAQSAAETEAKP